MDVANTNELRMRNMEITRKFIAALAIASVLFANIASADEAAITQSHADRVAEKSREQAKRANEVAAKTAAEAVLVDTRLDLDIRLIGPTSVKIASKR